MEIFISIDGVLRNTLQKFDYHYRDYYLNTDPSENNEDDDDCNYDCNTTFGEPYRRDYRNLRI